jgi:hypothetical protein
MMIKDRRTREERRFGQTIVGVKRQRGAACETKSGEEATP